MSMWQRMWRTIGWAILGLVPSSVAVAHTGLTSVWDLSSIRAAAASGGTEESDAIDRLLDDASQAWRWGAVSGRFVTTEVGGTKRCHPEGAANASEFLTEGAPDAYAQALAAHLTGELALAAASRSRVLDLVDTRGFHGLNADWSGSNQCVLELAISVPIWIETARLLEETPVWSVNDGDRFRLWLAQEVYDLVAWASYARSNNWGAAGSLSAWAIATYLDGWVPVLEEVAPRPYSIPPRFAAALHAEIQRRRIVGLWSADSRCARLGVQPHGGIPEELRRGSTGCDGGFLAEPDRSLTYQTMHVELLVFHAELMRRSGSASFYHIEIAPGTPAILQAILFVIDNPTQGGRSWTWPDARRGALTVAATRYDHPALDAAASAASTFRGGRTLPYAGVTHALRP